MSSESPSDRPVWPVAGLVLVVEQHRRRLEHLRDELGTLVARLDQPPDRRPDDTRGESPC